ncbi:MAG TPA: hypothetical protein VGD78_23905 [Chthoniobacterales bacterium]
MNVFSPLPPLANRPDSPAGCASKKTHEKRTRIILALAWLWFCAGLPAASAASPYRVVDIGTFPDSPWSFANAINAKGQVAGDSATSPGGEDSHPFLREGSALFDLGTLDSEPYGYANSLNRWGAVVGACDTPLPPYPPKQNAFLYQNGRMQALPLLPGGAWSSASAINDWGQVVGYCSVPGNSEHAFLYQGGHIRDLGTLGGSYSAANGINVRGEIVGESSISGDDSVNHAFAYRNGRMNDLGTLPGGSWSSASAIDFWGDIVGSALTSGGNLHAFLYQAGRMHDLGVLPGGTISNATALNAHGQVVGSASVPAALGPYNHAFLWQHGHMLDLNSLLPAGSDWLLVEADGINDAGQIVGYGFHGNSRQRGFVLNPQAPERGELLP